MNIRPRIIRGLLRLYPSAWRAEYGGELGALLSRIFLTPSVVVNVIVSATRERLRSDAIWKICGICLFAWTTLGIALNNTAPISQKNYEWYGHLWSIIVLVTGSITVLRRTGASPSWAAVKAATLGSLPELLALMAWTAGFFHPLVTRATGPYQLLEVRLALFDTTFPTVPQPHFVILMLYIAVVLIRAALIGFVGGLVGRVIQLFSPRQHLC